RVAAVERRRPGRDEALGRDDEAVPLAVQPAPQDLLGHPAGRKLPAQRVGIGGVEEVDAALGGPVEDRPRRGLVALESEGNRAQALPGLLEAGLAKSGVFHTR